MHRSLLAIVAVTLSAFAETALAGEQKLAITADSEARTVLRAVPEEAATERLELLGTDGTLVSYVGLADGPVGGVVFRGGKLAGTLSRPQAEMFYACRGYATVQQRYWAQDAVRWGESLLRVAQPAATVELALSGMSTSRSLRAVLDNPALGQVQALVEMGTNPLKVVRALSKAAREQKRRDADENTARELGKLVPGDSEKRLVEVSPPEDLAFTGQGLVLAYPKHSVDFVVNGGRIEIMQQPSFLQLARTRPAVFYVPDMVWANCTPELWGGAAAAIASTGAAE
ncbi:hypothetical protein [Massilia sp. YMA4]|uniref:hypothetical protein n=1 Tax=Massilia sp. YMA4 TaxID=1593482 RepID=UPI000DD14760|nr:hypothetical protein [Massilia sp. YMA4]AXA91942.1 hypothetical protein DPH57_12785 [Massilia sp. YMA4]